MKKKLCLMTLSFLVLISFCSCSNMDNIENNQTSTEQTTDTDFSYRTQMDIAMQHIDDPKTVATVNNVNITQVDMDLYSIGGNNHTVDEIVEYYVITDYAEKNSLLLDDWSWNLYDSVYNEMIDDYELTEEYCLENYGISKNDVIKYAQKRIYQIGMKSSFSSMVTNEVSNGDTPTKHPELKKLMKNLKKKNQKTAQKRGKKLNKLTMK